MLGLLVAPLACGGNAPVAEPVRSYTVRLHTEDDEDRYLYVSDDPVDFRVGDEVTFALSNTGALPHDLQVVAPAGSTIGGLDPLPPGGSGSVTVLFAEAGRYRLRCLVGDHLTAHRMQVIIEVKEPTGTAAE